MMAKSCLPHISFVVLISILGFGCGNQVQQLGETKEKALTRDNLGLPPSALGPLQVTEITVAGIPITVELAVTQQEQQQGLMYRTWIPKDHGMIFVYPDERFLSFWMSQTRLPLSIAFIRADGTIDVIRKMAPLDEEPRYLSRHRCQYALEMNQGWFEEHGVKPGDTVTLSPPIIDSVQSLKTNLKSDSTEAYLQ